MYKHWNRPKNHGFNTNEFLQILEIIYMADGHICIDAMKNLMDNVYKIMNCLIFLYNITIQTGSLFYALTIKPRLFLKSPSNLQFYNIIVFSNKTD